MPNLFDGVGDVSPAGGDPASDELVAELVSQAGVRIERIVSLGHTAPDEGWFDQDRSEWVMVAEGGARLRFEDEPGDRRLVPGDWVLIDAHRRHRVTWTDPNTPTVWLAVFFD